MVGREGGEEGGVVGGCGGEISLGIEKFLLKMVHNVRGQGFVVGVLVFDEGLFGGFEKSLGCGDGSVTVFLDIPEFLLLQVLLVLDFGQKRRGLE